MSVTEKKNNGGFSLVELIVVIAISVVLIGAATISIRSVMGVEVKQCARNIESIINKTRVTTMGKDSAVLEIYKDASDGAYYYKTTINGTVFKALLLEKVSDADDALHLYDVFMDGANYLGNVSSFSNKKEADTKIDYATLITYQNWTKE